MPPTSPQPPRVEILWSIGLKRLRERIADYRSEKKAEKEPPAAKTEQELLNAKGWGDPTLADKFDPFAATKKELSEVFQALARPNDPPLKVIIRPGPLSLENSHIVYPGQGSEIWLGLGTLAFTRDINELAGVLASELANARNGYDKALAQRLAILQLKETSDPRAAIAEELKKIAELEKQQKPVDAGRKQMLTDSLHLLARIEQQKVRDKIEMEAMKQLRINVDVSDETKRRILSAKDAIDRLVAAGFDPWKFLGPWKKMRQLEEMRSRGLGDHIKRLLGQSTATAETINLELEFVRNYVAFLEKKKVNLLNQPYRDVQLPHRLAALHYLAMGTQVATLQGYGKYVAGAGGTAAGATVAVLAWRDASAEVKVAAEKKVNESSDKSSDWMRQAVVYGLGYPIAGFIAATAEVNVRDVILGLRRRIGKFPSRYVDALEKSALVAEKFEALARAGSLESTAVVQALDEYKKSAVFLEDGLNPDLDRLRLRDIHIYLNGIPRFTFLHLWNHEERKTLHKDPAVEALFEEAREAAKVALTEKDPTFDERRDKSKLKKETKKQFEKLFVFGTEKLTDRKLELRQFDNQIKPHGRFSYQRFLYNWFGSYFTWRNSQTTKRALDVAEKFLAQTSPGSPGRAAVLEKLGEITSMQYLSKANQHQYLGIVDRYQPELELLKSPLEAVRERKKSIPEGLYQTYLNYQTTQKLNADDLFFLLKELNANGRYFQAAKLLLREFDVLVQRNGRETYSLISEIVARSPRDFGFPPLKHIVINSIALKSLMSLSNVQRTALWTHLEAAPRVPTTKYLAQPAVAFLREWSLRKREADEPFVDRLGRLDILNDVGATRSFLNDRLIRELRDRPMSLADIDAVIDREHLWRRFEDTKVRDFSHVADQKIFDRYSKLSEKYQAFAYDPRTSELIQTHLLSEYRRLNPDASAEDRYAFWEKLVSRGATGVTDALFDEVFREANPLQRQQWANRAFDDHLLWDKNLAADMYRELNQNKLGPQTLEQAAKTTYDGLVTRLRGFPSSGTPNERVQAARELHSYIMANLQFPDAADKQDLKAIQRLAGRVATAAKLADETATSKPIRALTELLEGQRESVLRRAKLGYLENQKNTLVSQFAEGGPVLVDLLDWHAKRLQTNREQTLFVKKQINAAEGVKNDELGYSVVNSIVQEAVSWEKEEKWALVRWLRGSGPAPPMLNKAFKSIGTETVRRLYTGMPIHVRRVFMAAIIDSTKGSLLRGSQRFVFQEQLLNELLPVKEKSAEIAHDLIRAFLKSVDQVSSPEKKILVLSHLLANHQDGKANAGVVLRNVLEAYGPVGVKFGQMLAGSDILPKEIRQELAKLRDGANIPRLYEIYEDLERILKHKNTDALIHVRRLLGSASMKYGLEVDEVATREKHALQIAREETRVSIPMDLRQLQIIIDDLIGRKPGLYAFLQGIGNAVQDATLRELSLVKETQKSAVAKPLYEGLSYPDKVDVNVPATTNLVERLPGPKSRIHAMRSSVFIDGKTLDQFPVHEQERFARVILAGEKQVLFAEPKNLVEAGADAKDPNKELPFDADRHPGNSLLAIRDDRLQYSPIDWGQMLTFLTPEARNRVIGMMAYSQIFERVGPQDALMQKFAAEFGFSPKQISALQKELYKNFPNRADKPRAALSGYYYLLAKMEKQGFDKNIVHYDFVKAIYQLEPYEELLKGKAHASPKEEFAARVEQRAADVAKDIDISRSEKIALAVRRPWVAAIAKENVELHKEGKLALKDFLGQIGLSPKGVRTVLGAYPAIGSPARLQSGASVLEWLATATNDSRLAIPKKDRAQIQTWIDAKATEQIVPEALTPEQFLKHATASVPSTMQLGKERKILKQPPLSINLISGVAATYTAEFVNAVFWSIWEKDKILAERWLAELMTIERHAGDAAFAVAATVYNRIFTRAIPMSLQFARHISSSGGSMAVGMIAADIARRLVNGQSIGEIADYETSKENLQRVGYATMVFMAAERVVAAGIGSYQGAAKLAARKKSITPNSQKLTCPGFFRHLGRMAAIFITADALTRITQPTLVQSGILPEADVDKITKVRQNWAPKLNAMMEKVDQFHPNAKNICDTIPLLTGFQKLSDTRGRTESRLNIAYEQAERSPSTGSLPGVFGGFKKELETIAHKSTDTNTAKLVQEEVERTRSFLYSWSADKLLIPFRRECQ